MDEYPCPHCSNDIPVENGWNIHADIIPCPHCNKNVALLWDEDLSGDGWFYFEKED